MYNDVVNDKCEDLWKFEGSWLWVSTGAWYFLLKLIMAPMYLGLCNLHRQVIDNDWVGCIVGFYVRGKSLIDIDSSSWEVGNHGVLIEIIWETSCNISNL